MIANATPTRTSTAPGEVFGRLTVLEDVQPKDRRFMVRCRCSCGVETEIKRHSLLREVTRSCGCLRREKRGRIET